MKKISFIILLFFILNQLNSIKYNIQNYTISDGLIDREVETIFGDSKGNIWIGTFSGGVNKFDGEKFVNYTKKDGLSHVGVRSIAEDKNGNIWFGTYDGLSKFDGDKFSIFKIEKDNNFYIGAIEIDEENNLWLATFEGLVKFNPKSEEFTNFREQSYPEEIFLAIENLKKENRTISSILKVGDNQNIKKTFIIKEKKEVLIVAFGESTSYMFDYGWLENENIIWDLSKQKTRFAGGGQKNRVNFSIITLKAGKYSLHYKSDDSHSFNSWNTLPPLHPELWGISLYEVCNDLEIFQEIQSEINETGNFISSNYVFSICFDSSGLLWIGTSNGLNRFDQAIRTFSHYYHNPDDSKSLSNNTVTSICNTDKNNLWIGTLNGLNRFSPTKNTFERFFADSVNTNSLTENRIKSLYSNKMGTLYIAPQKGGIDIYKKNSFNHITKDDGLISNYINSIIEDREGNIWFGEYGGISKFDKELFKIEISTNLKYIESLIEDDEGNLWYSVLKGEVTKYNGKEFIKYNITDKYIHSSMKDRDGNLWFGTTGEVIRYDGKEFLSFAKDSELTTGEIEIILEDNKGNLWIGSSDGLSLMTKKNREIIINNNMKDNKLFTNFTIDDGLISNSIKSILEDFSGNLWIATVEGLSKLSFEKVLNKKINRDLIKENIKFQNYTEKEGLIDNYIITMIEDYEHNLWLGTKGAGIMKFDGENVIANYTMEDGLADNVIFSFVEDRENNLWIGTKGGGVSKFNGKYFSNYNTKNSLLPAYINSICIDHNQDIWFATGEGLIKYDYQRDKLNQVQPTINFERIQEVNSQKLLKANSEQNISLNYKHNFLEFKYIGISMQSPSSIIYKYKLEGFDKGWKDTKDSKVTYSFLTSGKYTFYVKARNLFGLWSEKPAEFSFTILPPWYKTWWFYTIVAFVIFSIFYAIYKARVRILEKTQKKLEKEVETRTHELSEAYSDIEEKNIKLTDSIEYASLIQNSILPREKEISQYIKNFFIIWKPKNIVGGDFYWFFPIPKSRNYLISVIDCTGHGVPGAFMSMTANSILNNIVREKKIYKPDLILNLLHKEIRYTLRQQSKESQQDGMDISICYIDTNLQEIHFSGAMQFLFLIKSNQNEIERIRGNRFSIGGRQKEKERIFAKQVIPYNSGDSIYLMSDGLADQKVRINGKETKFKIKGVKEMLLKYNPLPVKERKIKIEEELVKLQDNIEQRDDIVVVGVKL